MKNYRYYAFISYSHKDEEWAQWLQHEFEHYHLPSTINGKGDLPNEFRPIFRDIDELSGGELKPQISNALSESANLIIICSPNSAKSHYVNEEIEEFLAIGRENDENAYSRIYPFIVSGVPHSANQPQLECFPPALLNLPVELIAGDATKHGREHAFIKILAGTLRSSHVNFSMLWDRFERDRIEAERLKREERDRLLLVQSRYLSEKAIALTNSGDSYLSRLLALEALPKNLIDPDRPYCPEAEYALRKATDKQGFILTHYNKLDYVKFSSDNKYLITIQHPDIYIWEAASGGLKTKISDRSSFCDLDTKRLRLVTKSGIWDIPSGKLIKRFKDNYNTAVFSNDGRYLAAYNPKGCIKIFNAETYKLIKKIETRYNSRCGGEYLAFGKNSKSIIFRLQSDEVYEYDIQDGSTIYSSEKPYYPSECNSTQKAGSFIKNLSGLKSPSSDVNLLLRNRTYYNAIAVSPNLKFLASAMSITMDPARKYRAHLSEKSDVDIYEIATGKLICTLKGHLKQINCINWNAKGTLLVSASDDKTAIVWDIESYLIPKTTPAHSDLIYDLVFDRSGRSIQTKSYDNSIVFWNVKDGKPITDIKKIEKLKKSFSSNSSNIEIGKDESIEIYDKKTASIISYKEEEPFSIWRAINSPNKEYIAVGNSVGVVKILDAKSLTVKQELNVIYQTEEQKEFVKEFNDLEPRDHISPIISLEFSPDSTKLVTLWRNGRCSVWDIHSGSYIDYPEPDIWIHSAKFSLDGEFILTSSGIGINGMEYEISLWNYSNNTVIKRKIETGITFKYTWGSEKPHVSQAAFSPDGSIIAASVNNYIRFFNPNSLEEIKLLKGHDSKVMQVFFTEDDKYLISLSDDSRVCIWETRNFKQLDTFAGVGIDEDYKILYDENLSKFFNPEKLLNLYTEEPEMGLEWLSPSGRFTARKDRTINNETKTVVYSLTIYDTESGIKICSFDENMSDITVVAFSHDEQQIVGGLENGTVKMWEFTPLQQIIDKTRKRFINRPLSQEEKDKYYLG